MWYKKIINKNLVTYCIVFFTTFFIYISNTPADYFRDLQTNGHSRLLTSADAVPNTFLPYLLYKYHSFDFSPITFHFRQFDSYKKTQYFISKTDGGKFSSYPVFTGVAAFPIYIIPLLLNKIASFDFHKNILKILLLGRVTAVFYSSLSVVLFYTILEKVGGSAKSRYLTTAFFAFGTNMWSISSRVLWTHTLIVPLLCLSILFLFKENKTARDYFVLGLICGLMVLTRQTAAVIVLFIGLYILTQRKGLVPFILGGIPPTIAMFIYNQLAFGNLLFGGYAIRNDIKWTSPMLQGIFGQLFTPGKGVFFVTPLLMLIFPALYKVFKNKHFGGSHNTLYHYFSLAFLVSFLMYSKWYVWDGGSSFGYRFLTDLLPIVVLLIYEMAKGLKGKVTILFYILFIYSVYVQWNAVFFLKSTCKAKDMMTFECLQPGFLPPNLFPQ